MHVRHAKLINVFGRPAKHGGFTFVPAQVELAGEMFRPSYHLAKMASEHIPPVLRVPIERDFDVAWVRGRIPVAFGYEPEPSEVEKSVLHESFVAAPADGGDALGFVCSDYYGGTSLTFSPEETDERLIRLIADAFWGLLLSAHDDLADFEVRSNSEGYAGYGCRDGEPYYLTD